MALAQDVLDNLDFLYIAINVAVTSLYALCLSCHISHPCDRYAYHFHMFAASTDKISWTVDGATVWNTVVTCLLQLGVSRAYHVDDHLGFFAGVYDMVYCPFHRGAPYTCASLHLCIQAQDEPCGMICDVACAMWAVGCAHSHTYEFVCSTLQHFTCQVFTRTSTSTTTGN